MRVKIFFSIFFIFIECSSFFTLFAQTQQTDDTIESIVLKNSEKRTTCRPAEKACDFTLAALEVLVIDIGGGFVNNLSSKNPTGMNFDKIKESFSRPWKFDDSGFERNQIIHPFAGAMYFTAARANGLNFYESSFLTGIGSYLFENLCTYGDTSINDMITTSIAGSIYGEILHRLSLSLYNINPFLGWIVSPVDCITMLARNNRPVENIGSVFYADGFLGASYLYNPKNKQRGLNFAGGSFIVYENPFGRKSLEPFDNFSLDINFFTDFSKYLVSVDADGTLYSWQILPARDCLSSIGFMLNYRLNDSDDYKYSTNSFGLFMRQKIPLSKENLNYYVAWDGQLNFIFLEAERNLSKNFYSYGFETASSFVLDTKRIAFRINAIFDYELQRNLFHLKNKVYLDFKFTQCLCIGAGDFFMLLNDDYIKNNASVYVKIRYN